MTIYSFIQTQTVLVRKGDTVPNNGKQKPTRTALHKLRFTVTLHSGMSGPRLSVQLSQTCPPILPSSLAGLLSSPSIPNDPSCHKTCPCAELSPWNPPAIALSKEFQLISHISVYDTLETFPDLPSPTHSQPHQDPFLTCFPKKPIPFLYVAYFLSPLFAHLFNHLSAVYFPHQTPQKQGLDIFCKHYALSTEHNA